MSRGSSVEHLDDVEVRRAVDGSPPMPTQVVWPMFFRSELEDRLVGEGAGAGDHADMALFVNVAGEAMPMRQAAEGILAGAGRRHDAGAVVGPDEPRSCVRSWRV